MADYNGPLLDALAQAMRDEGYDVDAMEVDASSRDSLAAVAGRAAALGPVQQVAHTAGLGPVQAPAATILAVNAAVAAYSLDVFGEVIADGGAGVVIASMAGTIAAMGQLPSEMEAALRSTPAEQLLELPYLDPAALGSPEAAYSIAKRANQLRVEAASVTWGKRGARVNCVSPGIVATPMATEMLAGAAGASMRAMIEAGGVNRLGTPAEVADAVAFLLSPAASLITGIDLLIDGGIVAAMRAGALTLTPA